MRGSRMSITTIICLLALPTAVAAQEVDDRWPDPAGATIFSGRIVGGEKVAAELTTPDGFYAGGLERAHWSRIDEPRLEGDITIATSHTGGGLGPTQDRDALADAMLIENADGTWVGHPSPWFWLEDDTISNRVHILEGTDEYDGLIALMQVAGDLDWSGGVDVDGIIFEGVVPEPPPFDAASLPTSNAGAANGE